ncbi:MAG: hypothetical protein JNK89_06900 [Saprospiraceae bacterium]|nr:hypothetical protein [Saprospiraceae bacterium]
MKTNPFYFKSALGLILFLFTLTLNGQNIRYAVSYNESVVRFVQAAPAVFAQLSDLEKEDFKVINEERQVQTTIDDNGDVTTTVIITSTNEYEPWMTPAARIVTDKNGTSVFDASGNLLMSSLETPESTAGYQAIKSSASSFTGFGQQGFPTLTNQQKQALQQAGATVTTLASGAVKIVKGATEMIYDAAGKQFNTSMMEGGRPRFQQVSQYATIEGRTMPVLKSETAYETLPSGLCIERVVTTTYSNYQFIENNGR